MSSPGLGYTPQPTDGQFVSADQAQLMQAMVALKKRQKMAELLRNSGVGQPLPADPTMPQGQSNGW